MQGKINKHSKVVCGYRTTQRFKILHSFMVCTHFSDFRYCTQNPKISGFLLRMHIHTNQTKAKMKREQTKIIFVS